MGRKRLFGSGPCDRPTRAENGYALQTATGFSRATRADLSAMAGCGLKRTQARSRVFEPAILQLCDPSHFSLCDEIIRVVWASLRVKQNDPRNDTNQHQTRVWIHGPCQTST